MLYVRELREPPRHEGIEDPGRHACQRRSRDRAAEDVRAEAGESEAEEDREVVRDERRDAEGAERRKKERDAVQVLAVRERVSRWIERVRLEERQRLVQGR